LSEIAHSLGDSKTMEEEPVISQGRKRTLPAEEPAVAAAPPVRPLGDAFDDYAILWPAGAVVRLASSRRRRGQ
jgi:hypothetical protein